MLGKPMMGFVAETLADLHDSRMMGASVDYY